MKIKNPILKGFHPDPSIIRVGDDYYIATSTFEWWPGVRLHLLPGRIRRSASSPARPILPSLLCQDVSVPENQ